jgi:methylated-DNA-[protein]-cysteine S-methyltransferase
MTPVSAELDTRFRDAAAASGLLDAAYDLTETPIGTLLVGASDRGLCWISFRADPEEQREQLARIFGPRVLRASRPVERARLELDEYFEGRRHAFDLDVDLRAVPHFHVDVLRELAKVPYGSTTTYGALATKVGHPKAARAVGTVMNRNRIPIVLPCHRVIGANGKLVGYAGGLDVKERLLRLEGALL